MSGAPIAFRTIEPRDFEQVNELSNRVFSRNRTLDQFLWEFRRGPLGPALEIVAVTPEDRVVGHLGLLPNVVAIGSRSIKAGKGETLMIAPEYRGKGIFRGLLAERLKSAWEAGFEMTWTTFAGAAPILLRTNYAGTGYTLVGYLEHLYFPLLRGAPEILVAVAKTLLRTNGVRQLRHLIGCARITQRLSARASVPVGCDLNLTDFQEDQARELLGRWRQEMSSPDTGPYRVTLERTLPYLRWRFFDNPNVDYTWRTVTDESGCPVGYIVWHLSGLEVVVDDMLLLRDWFTSTGISALLLVARETWRTSNVFLARFLSLRGSVVYESLMASGFGSLPHSEIPDPRRALLTRPNPNLKEDLVDELADTRRWYLSGIFTEGIS